MNFETLSLSNLINEKNLKYLDLLNNKILTIKKSLKEVSLESENFVSSIISEINPEDDPRKKKLKELKDRLEKAKKDRGELIDDTISDAVISAVSFAGPAGKFASIVTALIKKFPINPEIRDKKDKYKDQDVLRDPVIKIETIGEPPEDMSKISLDDPKWKEYFENEYRKWLEYNKDNPVKKKGGESPDFTDPQTIVSILSYMFKRMTLAGIFNDAANKGMKYLEIQQKINDIESEIDKLEQEEIKTGPSDPPGAGPQRINDIQGAGGKGNGEEKIFANSAIQKSKSGIAQKAGQPEKTFEAIFNKKNIGMMKVFDDTLNGVGQNIAGFFTQLGEGNPDAFKNFLKSIVTTFISSVQAMLFAAESAAAAKSITSFGLSLITDLPAIAAAWLGLEVAKGLIQSLNKGGTVQGVGDTDTVPAMLTPGEYVIKKSVVNKFGSGFFEWINGGGLTSSLAGHYANGGIVSHGKSMQLEITGSARITGRGSDLRAVITKENFRLRNARSAG